MTREKPLPKRQQEVLDFLRQAVRDRGFVPSIREIGSALGLQSTSTIHYHLTGLAERGLIRWEKGKNRAIQLLSPESPGPRSETAAPEPEEPRALPLLGCIAAGSPIEAIGDGVEELDLSRIWGYPGHYLLQVKGDSMIEDHIAPGDLVVVKSQQNAKNGEIVVALLENGEATLKRIYKEPNRIRLQPSNGTMKPIFVDRVQVQGCVVGVIRQVH